MTKIHIKKINGIISTHTKFSKINFKFYFRGQKLLIHLIL